MGRSFSVELETLITIGADDNVKQALTGQTGLALRKDPYALDFYDLDETATPGVYKNDNVEDGVYRLFLDGVHLSKFGTFFVSDDDQGTRYLKLSGGTMTGDIAMENKILTGLGEGTDNGHSVRFEQVLRTTGDQSSTGVKTFAQAINSIGTGTNKVILETATNPANGATPAMKLSYQTDNKPKIDLVTSKLEVTNSYIPTSAAKYISGNPASNDYIWKKYVQDNFQPIASAFQSYTILIDNEITTDTYLRQYNNPNTAIDDILAIVPNGLQYNSTHRWTLLIRQHTSGAWGLSIELPDWINLIGIGKIKINGKLTRAASIETVITSKIENLHYVIAGFGDNHAIDRLSVESCVLDGNSTGGAVFTKSEINNCGFIKGGDFTSSNNNIISNCYGDYDIAWQANDKVYSYDWII